MQYPLYLQARNRACFFVCPGFLPTEAGEKLKEIVYLAGFRWDGKERTGLYCHVPRAVELLEANGFRVTVTTEVMERIRQEIEADQGFISGVEERFRSLVDRVPGFDLRSYQLEGAHKLAEERGFLLADEPGLGKTLQVLNALPDNPRVMVISRSSAKAVWAREVERWRPDLKPVWVDRPEEFREPEPGEVLILHWQALPPRVSEPAPKDSVNAFERACRAAQRAREKEAGKRNPKHIPDPVPLEKLVSQFRHPIYLVCDEAQDIKNRDNLATKRWELIRRTVEKLEGTVWGTTASPLENKEQDLNGVLQALGLAGRCFPGGWDDFLACMGGRMEQKRVGRGTVIRTVEFYPHLRSPELPDRLARAILRRTRTQVYPEMPPKIREFYPIPAPKQIVGDMNSVWDRVRSMDDDTLHQTLTQDPAFQDYSRIRVALARYKTPFVIQLIRDWFESTDEPIVVASAHRDPVLEICREFPKEFRAIIGDQDTRERGQVEDDFREGRIRGVAFTQAGSVSMSFTRAWKMIFVDRWWLEETNGQAEDRLRPHMQTQSCHYVIAQVQHPIEIRLEQILTRRLELREGIVNKILEAPTHGYSRVKQNRNLLGFLEGLNRRPGVEIDSSGLMPHTAEQVARFLREPGIDRFAGEEVCRILERCRSGLATFRERLFLVETVTQWERGKT